MNKAKVSSSKQTSAVLKKQSVSSKSCICSVCTCGHHKLCKPVTTNDSPFDAHTVRETATAIRSHLVIVFN
ncbi:hypothetical protein BATDEDRAFT_88359 [Batrachochytrium dendrobatidis JAM81]|uniref:Uncharacterized protein n=1 Tax=Batrachochytrium dendrobatidis (strain JAM81 / FGSC 10211) TaxID=684364 RepID=F4P1J8_BATDJ|nr:uncharacterized protein BATDEDRAFT_88359 [Batrachochytrium dendrobatidis JAM81]EGF80652.1 hypothetical protein BATDEDRAFT_88359 [Batrachochytrium dendrobatidis JAM81]|eukprot:XP_006678646.1 hypothetical protein BATDEDRAFT_88359 [Batrachochytrium dendrobatidis JAM81]